MPKRRGHAVSLGHDARGERPATGTGSPSPKHRARGIKPNDAATGNPEPWRMLSAMTTCRCPICSGETHEIRAKLVCRQCRAILETCCEGGPMGAPADDAAAPPSGSTPPENPRDE
jgi:hypothetical protein